MNTTDHEVILNLYAKGHLIYTKAQMAANAYGKAYNNESPQEVLDDVATINEIMSRYSDSFVEFKSFSEDDRIRYNHHYSESFIGVGYTRLDLLPYDFPLGNHMKSYEDAVYLANTNE